MLTAVLDIVLSLENPVSVPAQHISSVLRNAHFAANAVAACNN